MTNKQSTSFDQQFNDLLERERAIIKKMNTAIRAGANETIIGQFEYMLQECKIQQQEIRILQQNAQSNGKTDFDNFLSIG
jgi:hypothetical protein